MSDKDEIIEELLKVIDYLVALLKKHGIDVEE